MKISTSSINRMKKILPKFNGILHEWEIELIGFCPATLDCWNRFLYNGEIFTIHVSITEPFRYSRSMSIDIFNKNRIFSFFPSIAIQMDTKNLHYFDMLKKIQEIFHWFHYEFGNHYSRTSQKIIIKNKKMVQFNKRDYVKMWI